VTLVDAAQIESVGYDALGDVFTSVALRPGAAFTRIFLPEDQGAFDETVSVRDGSLSAAQQLTLPFEGLGSPCGLVASGSAGIIALVQSNDGTVFMVGYSSRLGTECALRTATMKTASKSKFEDTPSVTVVLAAASDEPAKQYVGPLEGLLI